MEKIIIVCGPTACKKTETAIKLAQIFNGEVISADSMQIYKYMDIGTAKPDIYERKGVRHHLVDELYPDEPYSAADFKNMAKERISDISSRGKIPIITGGTGFYINALLKNTDFTEMETDREFRDEMWALANRHGPEYLYERLMETDPDACQSIHKNNVKRVIRALEYNRLTGNLISRHNCEEKQKAAFYDAAIVKLFCDRRELYENIEKRVDKMVQKGLFGEVKSLLDMGYGKDLVSMQGIGYKEAVPFLNGEYSEDACVYDIKINTRHFAKRQFTWFRLQLNGEWFNIKDEAMLTNIENYVKQTFEGDLL